MSTPVIEAIDNVNQTSLETVFAAVAADPTARDNLSQSDRNIDAVSTNVGLIEELNANEDAILRMLCRREGRNPANFADLDDLASDSSLVNDLSLRDSTQNIIRHATKAYTSISSNDRAARELVCGPVALDATTFVDIADLVSDNSAMSTIAANSKASTATTSLPDVMQEVASSQQAMQTLVTSQTSRQKLIDSEVAIEKIADSATAMTEMINEPASLSLMADSETVMSIISDSTTGATEVANSLTALDEIANNALVQNTLYNNTTSVNALENSSLATNDSTGSRRKNSTTLKSDRSILLQFSAGTSGSGSNQPLFSANSNTFPHTADRIRRVNNYNGSTDSATTVTATFIDISG